MVLTRRVKLRGPSGILVWRMVWGCGLTVKRLQESGFPMVPEYRIEMSFAKRFFLGRNLVSSSREDNVTVEIRADFVGGEYIFGWNTEISSAGGTLKTHFRQSQFQGSSLSREILRKSGSAFVPSLKPEAAVDKMILDLFSDGMNLEEISRRIAGRFPDRFPEWRKALTRVGELSLPI